MDSIFIDGLTYPQGKNWPVFNIELHDESLRFLFRHHDASVSMDFILLEKKDDLGIELAVGDGSTFPGVRRTGTIADETILGSLNSDTLIGGGGSDTFVGGGGNDYFIGGAPENLSNLSGFDFYSGGLGVDAVSYEASFGTLRVDLLYPSINTASAFGDRYESIENVLGSQGPDNIRGDEYDNFVFGAENVDYLYGRLGDDTLSGGVGDDVLFGGRGADFLIGGESRDRAQYSNAQSSLYLDLALPFNNTGEAAGDRYSSIEDLAGGQFGDHISGDGGSNRLFGRESHDYLDGRWGDDYINGGAGRDTLVGAEGDDTMRGGASRDTFVFSDGLDVIEDFSFDELWLHRTLWGEESLSVEAIFESFSNIQSDGVRFDFGSGNVLFLVGVSRLSELSDSVLFV